MTGSLPDWLDLGISQWVWESKYRWGGDAGETYETGVGATWQRVANAVAVAEPADRDYWAACFSKELEGFGFLPGGRILAGAGTGRRVTLFNCFVMGVLEDSLDGIFDALKEGAITMQQGGGVGYDFSPLRPRGTAVRGAGGIASGPVSFMGIWDSMCATLLSEGARRGAMMATLRCDHPDIEEFIDAKRAPRALRHFNLSVLVTDDFLEAVRNDVPWPLVYPAESGVGRNGGQELIECPREGNQEPLCCRVFRHVSARALWKKMMRAAYDCAEPGVLFIDRINRSNNLAYREHISSTNPCGEIPLPPYGACNLGSINLAHFVGNPFSPDAALDFARLKQSVAVAVRFLDDVIDVSEFPLPAQRRRAQESRRIGLGITGLGDALILLGLAYGTEAARELAARVMRLVCHVAYRTSVALAAEKGPFPACEPDELLRSPFVSALPRELQSDIARVGLRNSHLTAIAPAGTISLFAGNISSGIEPVFRFRARRRVLAPDGEAKVMGLVDPAYALWTFRHPSEPLPPYFCTTADVAPEAQLKMIAALQPFVDNSISKTVSVPEDMPFAEFAKIYEQAYALGLKGCTVFRPNPVTGAVLTAVDRDSEQSHCCGAEREAD